jgi:hypothetical protein
LTGLVQFTANGNLLGFAKLREGRAELSTKSLPAGTDEVVATYLGDTNDAVSDSKPLQEKVDQ